MIFTLVFLSATLLYPLKETYLLLKSSAGEQKTEQLWAVYWGFFSVMLVLRCYLPFLNIKPVQVLILLFSVWLYHREFKGALYLKQRLTGLLDQNDIAKKLLASVREWSDILSILESKAE